MNQPKKIPSTRKKKTSEKDPYEEPTPYLNPNHKLANVKINGVWHHYNDEGVMVVSNPKNQLIPVALFVRVSKKSQNYDRQVADLLPVAKRQDWTVTHIIEEKGSATKRRLANRPELTKLLELCRSGAIKKVLVTEFSRLGRLRGETPQVIDEITELGVSIYAHNLGMETLLFNGRINPGTAMVRAIMVEMAAQEVERSSERIISGQQKAVLDGKHIGRPKGSIKSDHSLLKEYSSIVGDLRKGDSIRRIASYREVSKATVEKVKAAWLRTNPPTAESV
ncbi:recombinase family protein [Rudanella lutea]|uniref:recombinase family protein n=1 Tax=Rudanella lutea TaxID=451374 RepID=UPI0003775856|nr:recombinase family protein [Rudanella lutea]